MSKIQPPPIKCMVKSMPQECNFCGYTLHENLCERCNLLYEEMKILDLVLKTKWYDMIESGEKKEEYREDKEYWIKRLTYFQLSFVPNYFRRGERVAIPHKDFTHVRFHNGYNNTTMLFELQGIEFGFGNSSWGAPDKEVFIIKLGKRVA